MKEKRYTLPEEQKDAAFAAEPAPAYHGNAAMVLPEDECAEEDIDWILLQRTILLGLHTRYNFLEKSLLDNQRQNLQARKIQQRCLLLYPLLQTLLLLVVGKVSCI